MAPVIRITAILISLMLCTSASAQTVRYVDDDAPTGGDGTTWTTAYKYLQDALLEPGIFDQIWVAKGTYRPDQSEHGHVTPGDREASFTMQNNLSIYGGFAGDENPDAFDLDDRDSVINQTVLSGDLEDNDGPALIEEFASCVSGINAAPEPGCEAFDLDGDDDVDTNDLSPFLAANNYNDNCYHVFYHPEGMNLDSTAVLDGVTMTGGNADGSGYQCSGGGMFNHASSPTLTHCTFSGNSARESGAGMFNVESSNPTLANCTFSGNSTIFFGGGMSNFFGSPTLTHCTFDGNTTRFGGGMYNEYSSPTLTNCTLTANSAIDGGGMYNIWSSSPTLTNCRFNENSASYGGGMRNSESSSPTLTNCTFSRNTGYDSGGMRNSESSSPTLTNCTFSGNSALYGMGGGMRNNGGRPTLTNCAFSGNSADVGGGMFNDDSSSPALTNCILWGNSAGAVGDEVYNSSSSTPTFTYCDIAGGGGSGVGWDNTLGTDGGGNIDNDPLLVRDPDDGGDGWGDDPDTPDIDEGANDDAGDLRLLAGSPCIDAGDNEADTDVGTPEIDPLPDTDLDGNPRFVDDPFTEDTGNGTPPIVDMGAYEYQVPSIMLSAASRRDHNGATYDLPVPLDGVLIEPRQNGTVPQTILSYDQPPADPGCGGIGVVGGDCISTVVLDNDLVIDMTLDANACVEITVGDDTLRLLTHIGNVNSDADVNVIDLQDVKNHVFEPIDPSNFMYDINCDGEINVIDLQETKNNVFTPLPMCE